MTEYFQIELTRGLVTQVNPEDWEELSQHKWSALRIKKTDGFYAISRMGRSKVGRVQPSCLAMHRVIMGHPIGMVIDHINGDPLDNRRSNLRLATISQNAQNCKKPSTNTSGFKGVSWSKSDNKWQVSIRFNGNRKHIGLFSSAEAAHQAYCAAAEKYHGEFARAS